MMAFAEASGEWLWNSHVAQWGRDRIDAALPDLRAAMGWAQTLGPAGAEMIVRIAGPLWIYWQTRGLVSEGRRWLETGLYEPGVALWCRGKELPALGFLYWIQGEDELAEAATHEALCINRQSGVTSSDGTANLVLALVEYRRGPEHVMQMLKYVDEANRVFEYWGDPHGVGACQLIYGVVARLLGDPDQALGFFAKARDLHTDSGYSWGLATGWYFAAETLRDLAERDPSRLPEARRALYESLQMYWEQGDFWGAGGALSGFGCIAASEGDTARAARYFGAASVLMKRVGGSLLPTELMTHDDVSSQLRNTLGQQLFDAAFEAGASAPDRVVEQTLERYARERSDGKVSEIRLTRSQMLVVRDLAEGLDVQAVTRRRGRASSSTYELVARILDRLGLDSWEEIGPFAIRHGLVDDPAQRN
jgi:non-specific serine/threonine protein kinase